MHHHTMIRTAINHHFGQSPVCINRMTIGICNEVYKVGLEESEIIIRLSPYDKYLMGSHDHIPTFKSLGITVPNILFEDYSKTLIPLSYQIQSLIPGDDLGQVIESLSDMQLKALAKVIAAIFRKVATIPASDQFGLIWGGGDNDLSDSWSERMLIWIEESKERGMKTGVMNSEMASKADEIYTAFKTYYDSIKPFTYYGDICSKNVMIYNGAFSGLVDLDGLTQGDPLEAVGRIMLSWYGMPYGQLYTDAIMHELNIGEQGRRIVTMYAYLNMLSWAGENGIQFNQNTQRVVNHEKLFRDRNIITDLAYKLF